MSIVQNTLAGITAPLTRRGQSAAANDLIDQSWANGYMGTQRNSADTGDLHLPGWDSQDQYREGGSVINPLKNTITVHIYPNAGLVTTAFFVNPTPNNLQITGAKFVVTTAGTVAGASAQITHETQVGGLMQAAGGGKNVLSAVFDIHGTAETVQTGTLAANYNRSTRNTNVASANPGSGLIVLQPGDQLSFVPSGTLTTAVGVTITLTILPGGKYDFVSMYVAAAATAATASLMTSLRPRTLMYGAAVWGVKESTAGTLTLDVTKDATATAPGAGTSMLSATVNLKGTAHTYTQLALSATAANLSTIYSDSVAVKISASTTELAGLLVTLAFDGKQNEQFINYNSLNSTVGTNEEFWIADRDYQVVNFAAKWSAVEGANGRVALTSQTGTNTPGSGGIVLQTDNSNAGFDTTGTINTVNFATLAAEQTLFVKSGDRLGLKNAGTLGSFAGFQLSARLRAM